MSRSGSYRLLLLIAFSLHILPGPCQASYSMPSSPLDDSNYPRDYPAEGDPDESKISELPPNISAPAGLKNILDSMLRRSPTFRRQCKLLRDAGNVRIDLKIVVSQTCLYKAKSIVQRFGNGFVLIEVRLAAPGDYIEMIGHEFEHAVEQAQGLNLKALASTGCCKVYEVENGVFETARALRAGHIVAGEYYSRRHAPPPRPRKRPPHAEDWITRPH